MIMSREQLNTILREYVQGKLDDFDLEQAVAGPANPGQLDSQLEDYDAAADHLWRDYTENRHVQVEGETVNQILKQMGITLDEQGYQLLCRELLKAEIRTLEANRTRLACNLEGTDLESILKDLGVHNRPTIANTMTPEVEPEEPPILLADLISDFKDMKIKSKKWSSNTLRN